MVLCSIYERQKTAQKDSYTFLNTLIRKNLIKIIILTSLYTLTENEIKRFSNIPIFLWDLVCRSWYLFPFSIILINMMKLLAILLQVKPVKTMISVQDSYQQLQFIFFHKFCNLMKTKAWLLILLINGIKFYKR